MLEYVDGGQAMDWTGGAYARSNGSTLSEPEALSVVRNLVTGLDYCTAMDSLTYLSFAVFRVPCMSVG